MAESKCLWSGYSQSYGILEYTSALSGDYPNIVMNVSWNFKTQGGTGASGTWSGTLTVNGSAYSCTATLSANTTKTIYSGSFSVSLGKKRTVSKQFSWNFSATGSGTKASGSGTASETLGYPPVWEVNANSNIGSSSATVTAKFTNLRAYYRYFLYDKNSGTTWYADSPKTTASTTYTLTGLKANTSYNIGMQVVDRNDNVVLSNGGSTSFKTLGISPVSVSSTSVNIGSAVTINTNRYSSSFTHTLTYSFGSLTDTIATSVGASCSWTVPTTFYAQVASATSGVCTITCETFNGSTSLGKATCTLTCNVASSIVPSVGTITVTETDSGVKAVNSGVTVRYLSKKTVSVKPSAGTGSSVKSVLITYGNQSKNASNSSGTWSASFTSLSDGKVTVKVTDNRNREASSSTTQTYYAYDYPTVSVTASRTSQTSSNGSVSVSGTYSTVLSNTVTMYFNRSTSATTTVSPTLSDGKVTYSLSYTDLYYTSTFNWTVKLTDKFGQSVTATYSLGQGQPTLWLGKDRVDVYSDLYVERWDVGTVPTGTIQDGFVWEHAFNIKGGAWQSDPWSVDLMVYDVGDSYPVKIYGGFKNANEEDPDLKEIFVDCKADDRQKFKYVKSLDGGYDIWVNVGYYTCRPNMYAKRKTQKNAKIEFTKGHLASVKAEPSGSYIPHHLLNTVYRVGSIYFSASSTSPATLFGGTWTQLTNRFLIGAGSSYSAGATGGATSHTHTTAGHALTEAEMPKHMHSIITYSNTGTITNPAPQLKLPAGYGAAKGGTAYTNLLTSYTGSGSSHSHGNTGSSSNMPPYLAVYMWQRTA